MQLDERTGKYIRHGVTALWLLAFAALIIAASVALTLFETRSTLGSYASPGADPVSTSPCIVESFYRDTSNLMEQAKYKEVIASADARLTACPADHYAFWFKGKALALEKNWEPALEALNKVELLKPDWRNLYIKPLREAIERQMKEHKKG